MRSLATATVAGGVQRPLGLPAGQREDRLQPRQPSGQLAFQFAVQRPDGSRRGLLHRLQQGDPEEILAGLQFPRRRGHLNELVAGAPGPWRRDP